MPPSMNIIANLVPQTNIRSGGTVANLAFEAQEFDAASISASYRALDIELTLGYQGNQTVVGSVVPVRGNVTIKAGTTIIASSYLYGVQGKLTVKGHVATTGGNGIIQCGVLAQLDLSAAQGITSGSQVTALWVDCGASLGSGVSGPNIDVSTFYQNISTLTANSVFRILAK